MLSLPKLKEKCQEVCNEYIRKRDLAGMNHFKCISCGQIKHKSQMNAGHYYSVGHYDGLRYDEDNIHGQCIRCNKFLNGNLIEYTERLPLKIGKDRFELLKVKAGVYKRGGHKWYRFEIEEKIKYFKDKIKGLPES